MDDEQAVFEDAERRTVELGNRLADQDPEASMWDIADGLLAGAVQYWLYSRQPCEDALCEDCAPISTAEQRMAELMRLIDEFSKESEYYHTPTDRNVGRA